MKVYQDIKEFETARTTSNGISNPIVTTGTFDGVHLGHQKIINRLRDIAKNENGETVLLTFYPHPRMVLFPDDNELKLLNSQEEKARLLENYGVQHLIVHPFTKDFSRLTSVEFVRNILVNSIGTKKLVIGYNHHFGRNREGSFEHLKEYSSLYGFDVEEIPAKDIDNIEISSTKIRRALQLGEIETATSYLGHHYEISGTVIEGNKLGRTIGYPTANIVIENKYKLIPFDGVYAVKVNHSGRTFDGMLNIGNNPTIAGKGRSIEVNIFNFNENIYGQEISIFFVKRLRDEVKFNGIEELKQQLHNDKQNSLAILKG